MTETDLTYALDDGKDPWTVLVVSVRADAEVDLARIGVSFVRCSELEDAVSERGLDVRSYSLQSKNLSDLSGGANGTACHVSAKVVHFC